MKKDFDVMTVEQVMQKQVRAVHLKTKCNVLASLMIEGFGAVPVVDSKDKLLGIVSEHDLLTAMDDGHKLGAVAAGDIVTFNPYSIHPEAMLPTLVHVLRASDLIRVPVGWTPKTSSWASSPGGMSCVPIWRPASRMLKMTPSVVLSRVPPCDVPQGYASVVPLPAALLGFHFEHPAGRCFRCASGS